MHYHLSLSGIIYQDQRHPPKAPNPNLFTIQKTQPHFYTYGPPARVGCLSEINNTTYYLRSPFQVPKTQDPRGYLRGGGYKLQNAK